MIATAAWHEATELLTPYSLDVVIAVLLGARAVSRRGRWFAARRRRG